MSTFYEAVRSDIGHQMPQKKNKDECEVELHLTCLDFISPCTFMMCCMHLLLFQVHSRNVDGLQQLTFLFCVGFKSRLVEVCTCSFSQSMPSRGL